MELNVYAPQVQSTSAPLRYATPIPKVETPPMDIGPFLRYEGRSPATLRLARPARRVFVAYGTAQVTLLPSASTSRTAARRLPIATWMVRLVKRLGQTE